MCLRLDAVLQVGEMKARKIKKFADSLLGLGVPVECFYPDLSDSSYGSSFQNTDQLYTNLRIALGENGSRVLVCCKCTPNPLLIAYGKFTNDEKKDFIGTGLCNLFSDNSMVSDIQNLQTGSTRSGVFVLEEFVDMGIVDYYFLRRRGQEETIIAKVLKTDRFVIFIEQTQGIITDNEYAVHRILRKKYMTRSPTSVIYENINTFVKLLSGELGRHIDFVMPCDYRHTVTIPESSFLRNDTIDGCIRAFYGPRAKIVQVFGNYPHLTDVDPYHLTTESIRRSDCPKLLELHQTALDFTNCVIHPCPRFSRWIKILHHVQLGNSAGFYILQCYTDWYNGTDHGTLRRISVVKDVP